MDSESSLDTLPAGRPAVLLVGGTDPGGGAGLAADIKAASAAGTEACLAVTAITVQNSSGVSFWREAGRGMVLMQVGAAAADCDIRAVKSGMLGSPGVAGELRSALDRYLPGVPLVVDPVLSAGSGDGLSTGDLARAIRDLLVPGSALVTPNLSEASILSGLRVEDRPGMEAAGLEILKAGAAAVLVKGGHLGGRPSDVLVTPEGTSWFEGERIVPATVHGTGCTLASAIAARLAQGRSLHESVRDSLAYLRQALLSSYRTGGGVLLGHFPPAGPLPGNPDGESFYSPPRFCSSCGRALEGDSLPNGHLHCPACGSMTWRNPLPAVSVVVRRGGSILLVRRATRPRKGMLCLPGGFLELGETVEGCARRELREETGLRAGSFALLGVETDSTDYGGIMLAAVEALDASGEPEPGDDASEASWFPMREVPRLAFAAHERIVRSLNATEGIEA